MNIFDLKFQGKLSKLYCFFIASFEPNQIQYLRIHVLGNKYFKVDTSTMRRNFFASVNGILSKCLKASDNTKLLLCETHCLPVIAYAVKS